MTRALQTAALLACDLGLLVEVDFELREWLPDDTFSWRSYADVVTAAHDFERCGGEWPAGQRRSWEPLSQVRERAAAALTRHLSPMNDDQVLIAVCHEMVIRALTGEHNTATGGPGSGVVSPCRSIPLGEQCPRTAGLSPGVW